MTIAKAMQRADLTPRQRKVWAALRWRARHRDQYDAYWRATKPDRAAYMRRYRARKREARSLRGG
jgi:hypothetical protein